MKFLYKILLWNVVIVAVPLSVGGHFFVNFVFETSMEREIKQSMEENSIIQFAFETAALNIPSRYNMLQDVTIQEIGMNLKNSGIHGGRLLRLADESKEILYATEGFVVESDFIQKIEEDSRVYQVISVEGRYYVQTGTKMDVLNRE